MNVDEDTSLELVMSACIAIDREYKSQMILDHLFGEQTISQIPKRDILVEFYKAKKTLDWK